MSTANSKKKKTIEETYQKLSQKEHILKRPGMYIGDVKKQPHHTWFFEEEMKKDTLEYSDGFVKIFDEILTNALDHSMRDQTLTQIKVSLNEGTGIIEVYNNGEGIPVVIHEKHKIYVPELIFGHLLSGSNYDDTVTRIGAGTNGLGSNCTNIFSKKFKVETVDSSRGLKFEQIYEDNMTKINPPKVTKTKVKGYTKISFLPDYPLFSMNGLENDTIKILHKRVYDCVICSPSKVKVFLDEKEIKGKGITDYIKFFTSEKPIVESFEEGDFIWEYAIIPHDSFEQISFVNGNGTITGGKHVDYILNQVISKLKTMIEQKKKIKDIKAHFLKDNMFLFLRATVKNPQFNSQTKETLTTNSKDFGVKVEVSDKFVERLYKTSIVENAITVYKSKQTTQLAKQTDGKKLSKIYIPKLEDALWAGTAKSDECSLILTEGLSAMTFAIWGRSIVGNEKYGVFPMKGKCLNVRDASIDQLTNNEEFNNIKKILGLKHKEDYRDTKSLRYGKVIVLTDADVDGKHICGLFMNFIHHFWPSLIRMKPSFIQTIKTPIVKAVKNKKTHEFFTEKDFRDWLESEPRKGYKIKYFKGLGTSKKEDAKEIFKRILELKVDYYWNSDKCEKDILLAFDKDKNSKSTVKCSDLRKEWLSNYDKNSSIDLKQNKISYEEFINKELIHFSVYDNLRSIPSLCDGFKPSQRKILYYMLKNNITKSIKVAQLSGYISAETGYHHGESSLQQAIISIAQDFIGTNNINLLFPDGNFGSRLAGISDAADPRYIFTYLTSIAFDIFDKQDLDLLEYLEDDGMQVEPEWFIPIIPMILVNGCSGIGTGYSTYVPPHNPLDIIKNLLLMLDNKEPQMVFPYFKDFRGEVISIGDGEYELRGIYSRINNTTLEIKEIPAGTWVTPYKQFLESLTSADSKKPLNLCDVKNLSKDENSNINFHISLLKPEKHESIMKHLKLVKKINTNNMYLFNKDRILTKYADSCEILKEYFPIRLEFYQKRREYLLDKIQKELDIHLNKMRFIEMYIDAKIDINRKTKEQITSILQSNSFMQQNDSYDYITSMPISSLSKEKIEALEAICKRAQEDLEFYQSTNAKGLWKMDLKKLYTSLS